MYQDNIMKMNLYQKVPSSENEHKTNIIKDASASQSNMYNSRIKSILDVNSTCMHIVWLSMQIWFLEYLQQFYLKALNKSDVWTECANTV